MEVNILEKEQKKKKKVTGKSCISGIRMAPPITGSNMSFCWCLEVVYLYKNKIEQQ